MSQFDHIIDMWGYYCEPWCKACERDVRTCKNCGTVHGSGQHHSSDDCEKVFQAERDLQLKFAFEESTSKVDSTERMENALTSICKTADDAMGEPNMPSKALITLRWIKKLAKKGLGESDD